jgi:hypothetical protein
MNDAVADTERRYRAAIQRLLEVSRQGMAASPAHADLFEKELAAVNHEIDEAYEAYVVACGASLGLDADEARKILRAAQGPDRRKR